MRCKRFEQITYMDELMLDEVWHVNKGFPARKVKALVFLTGHSVNHDIV